MPVQPTYPGVYIEEIPSGVRTIPGVATSITAFVGRARRGPVNRPITINNYGDYERRFGGLWQPSTMSFAVRDFYRNGGQSGIIVRLFHPHFETVEERDAAFDEATTEATAAAEAVDAAATAANGGTPADVVTAAQAAVDALVDPSEAAQAAAEAVLQAAQAASEEGAATGVSTAAAASAAVADAVADAAIAVVPRTWAQLAVDTLNLVAADPGSWGNGLRARVDHDTADLADDTLFNLSVQDGPAGPVEVFRNVSVAEDHARRVDRVLEQQSRLVRAQGALPETRPAHSGPAPLGVPGPGVDPFSNSLSSGVAPEQAASDGDVLELADYQGSQLQKTGIYALEDADLFNLLAIPPFVPGGDATQLQLWAEAAVYCEQKRAVLLVDPPFTWTTKDHARDNVVGQINTTSRNAALFFPLLRQPNPLRDNQLEDFAPSGAVAGVIARTDGARGVWKAPAGLEATLNGVTAMSVPLTDPENGELNPLGINCLRFRPAAGPVVWGSRTRSGDDRLASEWKYLPVRRLALFIEESLFRGTQWVVFEPNDEPLWAQIRLNVGAFMQNLFRQGAFQGSTPRDAYLVKCDSETTTQNDIDRGIVNIVVGFAPLKPAEFVIIQIQQLAGQIQA